MMGEESDFTRRREGAKIPLPLFSTDDLSRAYSEWGCNCGPSALAAICQVSLDQARHAIPDFDSKRYTNPSMMNAALRSLGVDFLKLGIVWPDWGLVRVQWEGPWTLPGVPKVARYRFTHWVGTALDRDTGQRGIFDCNAMANGTGWCRFIDWNDSIVPFILSSVPRANGNWHVTHCLSVRLRGFAALREKNSPSTSAGRGGDGGDASPGRLWRGEGAPGL